MHVGICIDHGYKGDSALGYARIIHYEEGVRIREGRHVKAYRNFYKVARKDIEGLVVRHKCDNPRCINPEHLELGTHKENTHDMLIRGRHTNLIPTGELNGRCKLTDIQVAGIRQRYKKGSRTHGSTKLAAEFGVTHMQILRIVKGLNRTQGSTLKEQTSWA